MEECIICHDEIGTKNVAVTPCGHSFCFNCMAKALSCNNTCPMCREVLVEPNEEEGDNCDDDFYGDDGNDEEVEEEEDDDQFPTVELITEKFLAAGYSAVDLVSLLTNKFKRKENNEIYTEEYKKGMSDKFDQVCDEVYYESLSDDDIENCCTLYNDYLNSKSSSSSSNASLIKDTVDKWQQSYSSEVSCIIQKIANRLKK